MKFNHLKQLLYLLIGIVLPLLSFGNEQSDVLFAKGNAFYAKAQYKKALGVYQGILQDDQQSAAVYFNMGNANYKLGDIPSALLYYEKANRLSPGDEDINFNLKLAGLKTVDKIDEVPQFFMSRWWTDFILSFSAATFSVFSIVFILLGSAFLILYFFSAVKAVKKFSFYFSVLLFFLGLVTVFITSSQVAYFKANRQAIVFSSPVNVKSEPAERAKLLFVIHDGTKVNILARNNGWMKISLANGNVGWVKGVELKEI
ncbi:tetratricopeptide repeat protein [Pedobacter sp. L105]|uniref:tetratricopeptide repeat protein n=1 Tax=Pedobacter sp. L105 TaxID=1641871 RepID=UPI0020B1235B|nr:tetratricopeptide repeat protein [Pedobacter sp. L105]